MSVDQLSELHQRYVDLSNRFKAAWTFHQFLQGLSKVFKEAGIEADSISFQEIYAELKEISKDLSTATMDKASQELDGIDRELGGRVEKLAEENTKVSPTLVRQFFGRVKSYDERILAQLLKFLIHIRDGAWNDDELDKIDFLLTRLGEELQELGVGPVERNPQKTLEVLAGLWQAMNEEDPGAEAVSDIVKEVHTLREAFSQIESLDQFNELGVIRGYRRLKHGLDHLLFHPAVAVEIVDANLFLRRTIAEFYRREEQRIAAEYQEVFELERGAPTVDTELDGDLQSFRGEVENFERSIEEDDVKLDTVARIRERARGLAPRLREAGAAQISDAGTSDMQLSALDAVEEGWERGLPELRPTEPLRIRTAHAALLADPLRQILKVLENSEWGSSPRTVAISPDAQPLRIEAREVLAYRRLHVDRGFEQDLEQFIVEAAAVRVLITSHAEEIIGMVDRIEDMSASIFERSRATCRLAGQFEHRFEYFIQQLVADGALDEARTLQFLRMRLLRDYSGLWLLVYA